MKTRRRLWRDRRGVAAVEFMFLCPVLIFLVFGTFELTYAFRMQAKLNTAAGTLAELVAGAGAVTALGGTLKDMCNGAKLNLLPFNSTIFTANIVSITNDVPANRVSGSTDKTTVTTYLDWEDKTECGKDSSGAAPATLGLAGATVIADTGRSLLTKTGNPASGGAALQLGYSVIAVKVQYQYGNLRTRFFTNDFPMTAVAAVKPRTFAATPCTDPITFAVCPAVQ